MSLFVIVVLAAGVFFLLNEQPTGMIPYVFQTNGDNTKTPASPENKEDEEQKLRRILQAKIEETLKNANERNEQIIQRAQREIASIALSSAGLASQYVPFVLAELTSFKECTRLCYLIAKDKLNGTTDTEQHIQQILDRNIIVHAVQGSQKIQNVLARLDDQFARNHTEMTIELAAATDGVLDSFEPAFKERFTDFIRTLNKSALLSSDISTKTVLSSFGLAVDALFLKSAVSAAQRVLGSIATRMGTTVAASLTSAAADGPLPIGDIIGLVIMVGGSAWSAYDLYKAQVTLKTDLDNSLRAAIQDFTTRTISDSSADIHKLALEYEEKNRRTAGELLAKL